MRRSSNSSTPCTSATSAETGCNFKRHASEDRLEFAPGDPIDLRQPSTSHGQRRQEAQNRVLLRLPAMRICIIIVGTRGDVQPFLAIAQRLQQDGHRVRLATHSVYRDFVMSHGVEFYPLGGDPKELAAYMVKTGGHLIPTKIETLTKDVPRNKEMIKEIVRSTWPAVSAADPDGGGPGVSGAPFQAQAIIANPVSYGHIHVAERLGVPLHIMFPQPWVPTMEFPHPLSNMPYTDELKKSNYMSYKMVDLLMWQGTEGIINEFRTKVLKLRKIRNGDGGRNILLDLKIPHAFMWSPQLVPKPEDWGVLYDVIGTVTLNDGSSSSYSPSLELEAFLGSDGGPIFVGFGSMVIADPLATTTMIIDAAKLAGVRVLIQSSWSDMAGDLVIPDNIFFLGNCPHDWLMPRVSAVVHHGGAGTTAAGLLAGKPTFIVPFFGDQPFWGWAVVKAGVGVDPCPIAELTTEKLCAAFKRLQSDKLHSRAMDLQHKLRQEDGAGEAVRCFYRHLPSQEMWCDLDHERIATRWSVRDRLKLCERCAFVVGERPNSGGKKMINYHCVDYTARGPDSTLSGASSGSGLFFHELAGAYTSLVRDPVKGFSEGGIAGGALGTLKGVGNFLVRPSVGLALFTDRMITGHINASREEGHHKQASLFDRRVMAALGAQKGLAHSYSLSVEPNSADIVVFHRKHDRTKMLHGLSSVMVDSYRTKYDVVLQRRQDQTIRLTTSEAFFTGFTKNKHEKLLPGTNSLELRSMRLTPTGFVEITIDIPSDSADTVDDDDIAKWRLFTAYQNRKSSRLLRTKLDANAHVPPLNICLAAIGTWDNGVKQFVVIGKKLAAHGHRVRLAANECFRSKIVHHGLEFYPLAGAPHGIQSFAKLVHDVQATIVDAEPGRIGIGALQTFRELIYSLWPAAFGSDPHGGGPNVPGKHFRADALLWHPMLLGHVHVAQRLGIPLQCASLDPLSPTFEFSHLLSSILGCKRSTMSARLSNLLSHGVVDATLYRGVVADVLTQFRVFIGLTSPSDQVDPLVEWEIPQLYLYSPAVLPKPLDWSAELTVSGHLTLRDGVVNGLPRILTEFASSKSGVPVIYFGVSGSFDALEGLLRKIDTAAEELQVRVVAQIWDGQGSKHGSYRSNWVHVVENDIPYAKIFALVTATIHWGEVDILAEGLMAGKPVGVFGSHPSQLFAGDRCVRSGVGIPTIDPAHATVEKLTWSFQQLLQPAIRQSAERLARAFDPELALNTAVQTFYDNLPLAAMRCDVDPARIARVFDSRHNLKLSLEAYLAVQPVRDDAKGFVPYKPLQYDGAHPPTFSIRGNSEEIPRDPKPSRELDGIRMALGILKAQDELRSSESSQVSTWSSLESVVNSEVFWTSPDEEAAVRLATNAAYERLVKPQSSRKRDKLAHLFSSKQNVGVPAE